MKATVRQDREDETEHGVADEYRFWDVAPVRGRLGTWDMVGIVVIAMVMLLIVAAVVLGMIDEVKILVRLLS